MYAQEIPAQIVYRNVVSLISSSAFLSLVTIMSHDAGDGEEGEEEGGENTSQQLMNLNKGEKSHLIVWQVTLPH